MADVVFEDYTIQVQSELGESVFAVLEECAGEIESAAKRNSRVDTGYTKGSFHHKVTGSFMAGEFRAAIGSDYENAIWEEFGTGEYAIKGGGRQGGWRYQDAKGDWHFTRGKRPSRAFWRAYEANKTKVIKRIQDSLKG